MGVRADPRRAGDDVSYDVTVLLPETALTRHRACNAPDLTPEQSAEAVRFEAREAAPESWTGAPEPGSVDDFAALRRRRGNRCPECEQGHIVDGPYEAETGWQYAACSRGCGWTNS